MKRFLGGYTDAESHINLIYTLKPRYITGEAQYFIFVNFYRSGCTAVSILYIYIV
jgi:hypothetical protein